MTVLAQIAAEVGASERTLRRGLTEGLVRGRRPTPRTVALAPGEATYLRLHWTLLAALREALRRERNVRLAVLIGSAARGSLREGSDVDVLVALTDPAWPVRKDLSERLAHAAGRPVDLVAVEAAAADPVMFDAALREGRVLVDRDARWPAMLAGSERASRAAARAADELRSELHALIAELTDES